ncbi:hypothetical protein Lesp02_59190 [Lentzea sp. NBRC 105346]|nr:hypothetical protein Lesp02_59190 [Lentzea sp. NBRC 105346]
MLGVIIALVTTFLSVTPAHAAPDPAVGLQQAQEKLAELKQVNPAARAVCYNAHLQDIGWQGARCNGEIAGTTGQSRRLEAIVIVVSTDVGGVCYNSHLQDIGWQGTRCNGEISGTTGQSRRLEAIAIGASIGSICYNSHLQDIGWQGTRCNGQVSGTTGQSRRLEAIAIVV